MFFRPEEVLLLRERDGMEHSAPQFSEFQPSPASHSSILQNKSYSGRNLSLCTGITVGEDV